VDRLPGNALKTALLEHGLGIPASYYFRAVPQSWDEMVIQEIAATWAMKSGISVRGDGRWAIGYGVTCYRLSVIGVKGPRAKGRG